MANAAGQLGWTTEQMAERAARDIPRGAYVNLGIGLPLKVAPHVPPSSEVMFHSENGILGLGPMAEPDQRDEDLLDAGKNYVTLNEGAACFDSSLSFCMMRGGYIDIAIMGGHEVAVNGDLANWTLPGQTPGVGGAMDLAAGAKQVWIIMRHLGRTGQSKIVETCSLPLTGHGVVDRLFTDLGVFEVDPEGITLIELAPNVTWEYLMSVTPVAIDRSASLQVG